MRRKLNKGLLISLFPIILLLSLVVSCEGCCQDEEETSRNERGPSPADYYPWIEKYAPILYLCQEDSSPKVIDSILNKSKLMHESRSDSIADPPITTDHLNNARYNSSEHYLDLPEDLLNQDMESVQRAENFASYNDIVYARVFLDQSDANVVLQYWFFYPYDDWDPTGPVQDFHEGDWEMVAIVVDTENGTIKWAGYAQHFFGYTYYPHLQQGQQKSLELERETHPKVFVAKGSHASFASKGLHSSQWENPLLILLCNDTTSDEIIVYPDTISPPGISGTQSSTSYKIINVTEDNQWKTWQGRWGENGNSPSSPGSQGVKWDNPLEWSQAPTLSNIAAFISSPVNLHAYDQYGNHVGVNELGEVEMEIPGTYLFQPSNGSEELIVIATGEDITFVINATGTGSFHFQIGRYLKTEDKKIAIDYPLIEITEKTVASVEVSSKNPNYTLNIDYNGDGIFDRESITPKVNHEFLPSPELKPIPLPYDFKLRVLPE